MPTGNNSRASVMAVIIMAASRPIDETLMRALSCSCYTFPLFPPQAIYLREWKCQRWHLNPPRGQLMKVRLRTEKVTLRNDSGHSPRGYSGAGVVRISEERR
jgi:hypothetical protein